MKVRASVFMTLKVEVLVGSWEAAQSFADLHKQAEREARQAVENTFRSKGDIRLLPEAGVMHVVTREEK